MIQYVRNFFNNKTNKNLESDLSIVFLQNNKTSEKRNFEGQNFLKEKIDLTCKKVLEIGYVIGRWTESIPKIFESYLGINQVEDLIFIAKNTRKYIIVIFKLWLLEILSL